MNLRRAAACVASLAATALIPVLLAWVAASGCTGTPTVRGSGIVRSEQRDVAGFTAISLSGSGQVVVEQTGAESLTVEAEDNILPLLETRVMDGRLTLGTKRNVSISPTRPIQYHITVKSLTAVAVSGSGSFRVKDLDTDRLRADISGSGSAILAGSADDVRLSVSGSGDYDAADLKARTAEVTISGSGSATVNATDHVDAHISGSGSVRYLGTPTVDQHVSGSGSIARAHE